MLTLLPRISGFVSQATVHIQVLDELAAQVKAGQYTDSLGVPKKLVLVGHSIGSFFTNSLFVEAPEIADAAILTGIGFTQDGATETEAFGLRIAAHQDKKWSELDNGYLIWGSIYNNVNM